jgi:hypothetical protein
MRAILIGITALLFARDGVAAWSGDIASALWKLDSAEGSVRWLEIHNLQAVAVDGLYHVEVMQRSASDPVWKFEVLAAHMAVTDAAIRASIVSPLRRAFAYQEAFDQGMREWQQAQAHNQAFVCRTSVNACLAQIARH